MLPKVQFIPAIQNLLTPGCEMSPSLSDLDIPRCALIYKWSISNAIGLIVHLQICMCGITTVTLYLLLPFQPTAKHCFDWSSVLMGGDFIAVPVDQFLALWYKTSVTQSFAFRLLFLSPHSLLWSIAIKQVVALPRHGTKEEVSHIHIEYNMVCSLSSFHKLVFLYLHVLTLVLWITHFTKRLAVNLWIANPGSFHFGFDWNTFVAASWMALHMSVCLKNVPAGCLVNSQSYANFPLCVPFLKHLKVFQVFT